MSRALTLIAGFVLALAPGAARAGDEPKDIIAKAVKAHGGEDTLTKYKASQSKAKGKITLPGLGETDFAQEISSMIPDKLRDSLTLTVMGKDITLVTIVNGEKMTIEANGKDVDVPDAAKDALKELGNVLEIARMVPLKNKKYELSVIGEDKVEGKKVVGVLVKTKGHKDVSVYFDKETGLLAKLEFRGSEPGTGNEVNEERIVSDYVKTKEGLMRPKKVIVKHDGKTFLEAEITETTYLEKLDDSVFKK